MRGRLRNGERHALEARQRAAEGPPLLRVGHRLLDRDLGDAQAGERDAHAVVVEALHDLVEGAAFLADAVRGRNAHVIERKDGAPDHARAHVALWATRHAGEGRAACSTRPRLQRARAATVDAYETLTRREREVLQLISESLTNARIASRLSISRRTAEAHQARVMQKMSFSGVGE